MSPASLNSSRRRRPTEPSTPRFKSTAGTDSSKITSWRSCSETSASRRSMKGRRRSSDSSLRVRFSGSEHGKAHARWYRIIAEHYDRLSDPRRVTRAHAFLRQLFHRHPIGREVLDVACGTFAIDLPLVKRGYQVVGRDRSEAMIRVARRNLRTAGVTADVDRADMRSASPGSPV